MKNSFFILLINLLLLTACGKDRSGEYYALTQDCRWIDETMMQHYLWNEDMGEPDKKDFFAPPEDFLKKRVNKKALDGKGDRFSRIESKATTVTRSTTDMVSYGFEFELITDPLGTTRHNFARVLLVYPNSPAEEIGLKRGDWIGEVNGENITVANSQQLISGGEAILTRTIITNKNDSLVWQTKDELSLPAARFVEKNPFYLSQMMEVEGKKIAYLIYNQFKTGPNDQPEETEYAKQMIEIFDRIKSQSPDAFILDLRFNGGGYLSCAVQMASLLAPINTLNSECFELKFNETTNPQTESIPFDASMAKHNLGLNKLYVLTSRSTASASEALINGLIPYLGKENIITIGEQTYGKPVATNLFTTEELSFNLHLVTAYVLNSEGKADYNNGFTPTYQVQEEDARKPLLPLGDTNELLLNYSIGLITQTIVPTPDGTENNIKYRSLFRSYDTNKIMEGLKLN